MRGDGRWSGDPMVCLEEVLFSGTVALTLVTTLIFSSIYWSGYFFGWRLA